MSTEPLLPCPFCGGKATIEETSLLGDVRKSAGCGTEHCQGYQSTLTFSTHREAAAAWNTRALHKCRIYTDHKQSLLQALETMTDEWIEGGQYCEATVMDLRDVLRIALTPNDRH